MSLSQAAQVLVRIDFIGLSLCCRGWVSEIYLTFRQMYSIDIFTPRRALFRYLFLLGSRHSIVHFLDCIGKSLIMLL
jgi:hypothetical protein